MKFKQKIIKILRWSQKYTQTDMVYLATGGFWLTLWQFVYSASTFLLSIIFANLLPKEVYGNYCYILSVGSILAIPTLSSMNTALVKAIAQGHDDTILSALKTRLRWGILGGLAGLGIAGYYYINNNIVLSMCFFAVAIFVPLMNSFTIYQGYWAGKKRFDTQAKYNIIIQILSIAIIITTLFLTKNIFLIILAYFVSYTLFRFIFLQITIKKMHFNGRRDPEALSYGKHLSLMGVIDIAASYLDRIIIWHYLGPVSVAIYYLAVSPPQKIGSILKNIGSLALPKFSQRTKEELKNTLFPKVLRLFLLVICLTAIYIILAPFLYKILFPQYLNSILYSQIFSISIVVLSGTELLSIALIAQMKKNELYIAKTIPATIEIILFLTLIPFFGIWGAIYAVLITEFVRFGLYLFLFKKI